VVLDALPDDRSAPLDQLRAEVLEGMGLISWPAGAGSFSINPVRRGNGVGPIKTALIDHLAGRGWDLEAQLFPGDRPGPIDAYKEMDGFRMALEWETGNVASSYRVILKLMKALVEGRIDGGILIVSSKRIARYLTDRIGTHDEIAWALEMLPKLFRHGHIEILVMDADRIDSRVPLIPKLASGMGRIKARLCEAVASHQAQRSLFEAFDVEEDAGPG